ncbi:MAG: lycopene cyclase domain-containing protein [Bacteroidia bacterium]|nr:lycopene cyclase domain-containing protein [Bacteroidia bacterium]NNJ55209.1 lycopene cyclase domain-containing protein [Bacteroidia bacterium]
MNALYLWVNLGAIFFPFILSFNKIGHFYKRWKPALISILIMNAFILSWDILFTINGVWGFNEDYLVGISFLHLPLEEWLFFICIPYAFMFLYDQLVILKVKSIFDPFITQIDYFILIVAIIYLIIGFGNIYTTTISSLVIAFILIMIKINPPNRGIYYLSYLIILVPFTIVNGILTGYITPEPIVWYNNAENLNVRFLTIPLEDYLYYFLMYGISYVIFEKIKKATSQ